VNGMSSHRLWRVVGAILLVGLIAWLGLRLEFPLGNHPAPEVLGLGDAFSGSLQLPAETIKAALEAARNRMLSVNNTGNAMHIGGEIANWLSFGASAAITLVIGFYGRPPAAAGVAPNTEGLSVRAVRLVGIFAALAAVLTALGSLSLAKAQDEYKNADAIRDLLIQARAQVIDAATAEDAQAVLDNLALKSGR
jgi:hypothetical protein